MDLTRRKYYGLMQEESWIFMQNLNANILTPHPSVNPPMDFSILLT